MSKYHALWAYIQRSNRQTLTLNFDEIGQIAEVPLAHFFLKYKMELFDFGYEGRWFLSRRRKADNL